MKIRTEYRMKKSIDRFTKEKKQNTNDSIVQNKRKVSPILRKLCNTVS